MIAGVVAVLMGLGLMFPQVLNPSWVTGTPARRISWPAAAADSHAQPGCLQRLNGRISRLRAMTISSSGRNTTGPAQMRKIVEAIRNHDPVAASQACREHVQRAATIAENLIRSGGNKP